MTILTTTPRIRWHFDVPFTAPLDDSPLDPTMTAASIFTMEVL